MPEDCLICAKHRGEGPLVGAQIWADELVIVTHLPVGADGTAALGYVFVETSRHVASLDTLTEAEAASAAGAAWRATRGVRAELAPEFIFTAMVGLGIPHFHQHVIPRYHGTPSDHAWMQSTEWSGAPRGNAATIADLVVRLRRHF